MASKNPQVRAIEQEAKRRSLADDGKTSHAERFRIRKELRAEAGLGAEQRKRGGVAGFYDANKEWLAPVASGIAGLATGGLLAPVAIGAAQGGFDRPGQGGIGFDVGGAARGGLTGAAAGSLGRLASGFLPGAGAAGAGAAGAGAASASGALPPVPVDPNIANANVTGLGGGGFSLGGLVDKGKDFLLDGGGKNLLGLAQAANTALLGKKQQNLAKDAMGVDTARWAAGAPLRAAGRSQMLNPVPIDTGNLTSLQRRGNPFAMGG